VEEDEDEGKEGAESENEVGPHPSSPLLPEDPRPLPDRVRTTAAIWSSSTKTLAAMSAPALRSTTHLREADREDEPEEEPAEDLEVAAADITQHLRL
jgi:hypothetical protein